MTAPSLDRHLIGVLQLAEDVEGLSLEPLIWSLAFGSCLGGMGTLSR